MEAIAMPKLIDNMEFHMKLFCSNTNVFLSKC